MGGVAASAPPAPDPGTRPALQSLTELRRPASTETRSRPGRPWESGVLKVATVRGSNQGPGSEPPAAQERAEDAACPPRRPSSGPHCSYPQHLCGLRRTERTVPFYRRGNRLREGQLTFCSHTACPILLYRGVIPLTLRKQRQAWPLSAETSSPDLLSSIVQPLSQGTKGRGGLCFPLNVLPGAVPEVDTSPSLPGPPRPPDRHPSWAPCSELSSGSAASALH